ncbi:MAG: DUF1847 domain-containing protein [Chloroflexi bacterium]|jgi:uncharacterized metal-binding protein|nr:DUF1847 domain-containing protein [Chloroflexota bacterium]MBT7081553.1 DUF1847 domain-containing protein [Chloroflexota bacterium]MBT7289025.1 DUF1847 domain-containing protein [Chloroflexota bacterium]
MPDDHLTQCSLCTKRVCSSEHTEEALENCPMITSKDVLDSALANYDDPELLEFARQASIQEAECHGQSPLGKTMIHPRVEETYLFAKKMGYKKLGLAFCMGLSNEAKTLTEILQNKGFEVVSVCCKCGAVDKSEIGLKPEDKISKSDKFEAMCNPIAQAKLLNDANTDFNILIGLCVGHDALFLKHVEQLTTVMIVKDRVTGHNPAAVLYAKGPYYRRLYQKEA